MPDPSLDRPADEHAGAVVHNEHLTRYELHVDGRLAGVAVYRIDAARDGRVVFTHTEVDVPLRGKGWSDLLVRAALDDVRAAGKQAATTCWFVQAYVDGHPEYADLFEGRPRG